MYSNVLMLNIELQKFYDPICLVQWGMKKVYFWSFIDWYNSIG